MHRGTDEARVSRNSTSRLYGPSVIGTFAFLRSIATRRWPETSRGRQNMQVPTTILALAAGLLATTALLGWSVAAVPVTTEELLGAQDNAAE